MKTKILSILLCGAMIFGFYSCEKPLTEAQIQAMIDKSIPEQEKGLSDEEIQDLIDNAIAEHEKFNCHAYVDLGLSVLWATCNVGAITPEGYGDYFAWGETKPKTEHVSYSWSSYKWCEGESSTLTKYCTDSIVGTVDYKTTLDPEDDAARVNWGGNWRMPTLDEQNELMNNCTWTWTDNYNDKGVKGYIVTGNNNSIFLPSAGYYVGHECISKGSIGRYWGSSILSESSPSYACIVHFTMTFCHRIGNSRCYGQSVRAVCSK